VKTVCCTKPAVLRMRMQVLVRWRPDKVTRLLRAAQDQLDLSEMNQQVCEVFVLYNRF